MTASKVLVATDFSEIGRFAVDFAANQARTKDAGLLIVHVLVAPDSARGEGMLHSGVEIDDPQAAEQRLRTIEPGSEALHVEHRVCSGDPAKEILRLAEDEQVEMIVMGTHGRTGMMRALMGSVAEQVARNATCPVLLVKIPKSAA